MISGDVRKIRRDRYGSDMAFVARMAQLAGFELESRHADWSGAAFTAESRSHVSVYRLPS
ncbi:hypothetical protein GCM10023096_59510 [Nonomuraea ferruginea]